MTEEFCVWRAPLERGMTLLEASAGTGKTYALAGIYLRLIVEENLLPAQILVSTYTVPATSELRDRLRKILRAASDAFSPAQKVSSAIGEKDTSFEELLAAGHTTRDQAHERIERALRSFDEAAIYTIHGFCQRLLQDRAFESGRLFAPKLVPDQQPIFDELADDYWRRHFYTGDPVCTAAALQENLDARAFARLLQIAANHPDLHVLPRVQSFSTARDALAHLFRELRKNWPAWRDAVHQVMLVDPLWAIGESAKSEHVLLQLDLVHLCLADERAPLAAHRAFDAFTPEKLAADTSKKNARTAPQHPFFHACGALKKARAEFAVACQVDFLNWAGSVLPRRKMERQVWSFDDLLTQLHAVLAGPSGLALAELTRSRYRAALIDEFQDTDVFQERIFRQLFGVKTHWLFLIGDPKQAIYGFRGADIFAYVRAAAQAERRRSLNRNFRSSHGLVSAVNTVFRRRPDAFIETGISFHPVEADERAKPQLTRSGSPVPPFVLHTFGEEIPLGMAEAEEAATRHTAREIARLLDGQTRIGNRTLQPSDIAVLTVKNAQARAVQKALRFHGIASVLLSAGNVFHAPEASELHVLLAAFAQPARDSAIRAALASTAFEVSARALHDLAENADAWEKWLLRFQAYRELWRTRGFMAMFRAFLAGENVRSRFLRKPNGDRQLTNLLQLGEILHAAETEFRLTPEALQRWLAERCEHTGAFPEEHEMRLESDEQAVRIITVHKSKGLEFPVVFCPFSWSSAELRRHEHPLFHDCENGQARTLDLGPDQRSAHVELATRERLAEHVRLLYVACTRAALQMHLFCGRIARMEFSALPWLLHSDPTKPLDREGFRSDLRELSGESWKRQLADLAASEPALAVCSFASPSASDEKPLLPAPQHIPVISADSETWEARVFQGQIEHDWHIASFTSLTAFTDPEQPDFDRLAFREDHSAPASGIHSFPRGVKAGVCFHEIMEEIDFTQLSQLAACVSRKLKSFGLSAETFAGSVTAALDRVLRAALLPGLFLENIGRDSRLDELEFYLPANRFASGALMQIFRDAPTGVGKLRFDSQRGFVKGFIDLVFEKDGRFYIVDWKSNWLGPDSTHYHFAALQQEMERHHYILQAYFYALALHRYLSWRLPDYDFAKHFGGVFYVFLRSVDDAYPDRGTFRLSVEKSVLENLDALFSEAPEACS